MKETTKSLNPEDSDFIPEVERDPQTGEMVDVDTRKKFRRPFKQGEYKPLTDYGG